LKQRKWKENLCESGEEIMWGNNFFISLLMPCNNLLLLADTENRILAGDQSKFWLLMGQILILVLLVLPSSFTRMRDPSYVLDIWTGCSFSTALEFGFTQRWCPPTFSKLQHSQTVSSHAKINKKCATQKNEHNDLS